MQTNPADLKGSRGQVLVVLGGFWKVLGGGGRGGGGESIKAGYMKYLLRLVPEPREASLPVPRSAVEEVHPRGSRGLAAAGLAVGHVVPYIWVPEGSLAGFLGCVFEVWPAPGAREGPH